ncbi:MAG TPA: GTP cyclohydrolase FolE2 [Candidatus Thiothrix moscowensis]|uniref:GTP cyclohydrolase FolE2 n=1 Tax=unclassified Thiothrix TaxID=2636184 RepID=UPI0025FC8554|nr:MULTISPECIES: GTP cyclohydrolase FolE2 [unclassified Thiothrix]HRJ51340.1 GTP cyclohydrolase FolE2 [Candidatus Thiothrix moscowensis]HRJ91605.1 GTP cyclohydrolase FolE2 [Candidatus Thiothrix moscowensis]
MSTNACQELPCAVMPDIAKQPHAGPKGTLNWVGMSQIELPVFLRSPNGDRVQTLARVQAYVNLVDPNSKGIHMSRLYVAMDNLLGMQDLTPEVLRATITQFVDTHQGLSDAAYLECRFDYFERRNSLLSDNSGWKNYPIKIAATLRNGQIETELSVEVPYSSTCPCSAALARQLIQEGFRETFGQDVTAVDAQAVYDWLGTTSGIRATPHSQRSIAQVKVKLAEKVRTLPITSLIDRVEGALQTPVQATVKREDEQEFARLNAANLMFCEDAARRLKTALNDDISVRDFWLRVNHMESLHAHDAVSVVVKGVEDGYRDDPREYVHPT